MSIRLRLALWYGALFALILLLVGLLTYALHTRGHYDVPLRDCTVELDGKVVIDRGRITDEKMRVARIQR